MKEVKPPEVSWAFRMTQGKEEPNQLTKKGMKTAIKVFAILAIILGGLALLGSFSYFAEGYGEDGMYGLLGGAFYTTFGILSLVREGKLK